MSISLKYHLLIGYRFRLLNGELSNLYQLKHAEDAPGQKHAKIQIADIFERINEARVQFEVRDLVRSSFQPHPPQLAMDIRVFKSSVVIEELLKARSTNISVGAY